jgi:hypothetical protein
MSESIQRIEALLAQLDEPEQPEDRLKALRELDALTPEDRETLPPRLVHFIQKRSYEKARQFIKEGTDQPHGPG